MNVRVKVKIPHPGVQYGGDAELRWLPEPLGISSQRQQTGGGGLHEQLEHEGAVRGEQLVQLAGQGEDDVKVVHGHDTLAKLWRSVCGDTLLVIPALLAALTRMRLIALRVRCVWGFLPRWPPGNRCGPAGRYARQYVRSASRTRGLSIAYHGPVLPVRTWISMRWLSISVVSSAATSLTRKPPRRPA